MQKPKNASIIDRTRILVRDPALSANNGCDKPGGKGRPLEAAWNNNGIAVKGTRLARDQAQ
ncbi:MAG: hypothetical protein LIP28_08830 [Deltaproteobacteria bacterium]|nr:hypothetical protein [Deltaproteobacteria bacterium]